jgi:hypothetical protein
MPCYYKGIETSLPLRSTQQAERASPIELPQLRMQQQGFCEQQALELLHLPRCCMD